MLALVDARSGRLTPATLPVPGLAWTARSGYLHNVARLWPALRCRPARCAARLSLHPVSRDIRNGTVISTV
jgi:hypothetical protein